MENNETEKKSGATTAIVIGIVVLVCCICALVIGMGVYGYYAFQQMSPGVDFEIPDRTLQPARG